MVQMPKDKKNATFINNDDFKDNSGIKELNKLLGLEWEDIDTEKISQVNYERFKEMDVSSVTKK
jgi:hypothetical protein